MDISTLIAFALATTPGTIPPAFRGTWAVDASACRAGDPRDRFRISAKRFRDARVVASFTKAGNALEVTLRIPSGARVRRILVLEDRGQLLRVAEEIGIMGYVRCDTASPLSAPNGRGGPTS